MDDDDQIIETDALFSRPFRTIFGKRRHSWLSHKPKVTYAVLVGRNVTTDAQTLDSIINPSNRLRTTGGVLGSVAVVDDGTSWTMGLGEWGWFLASGAGNATVALPSVAPAFGESLYEVHQILQTLTAVGIATRTMTVNVLTGMTDGTGAAAHMGLAGPTAITDTQFGTFFVPRAPGLAQLNDNGTFTTSDISPLPVGLGDAGTISSVIGAGVAADTHTIGALVRRVA